MTHALKAYAVEQALSGSPERAFADLYGRIANWCVKAAACYQFDRKREGDTVLDRALGALNSMEAVLTIAEQNAETATDQNIAFRCRVLTRAVIERCHGARVSRRAAALDGLDRRLYSLSQIFAAIEQVNQRNVVASNISAVIARSG